MEVNLLFPLYRHGTVFDAMWACVEAKSRSGAQASINWGFDPSGGGFVGRGPGGGGPGGKGGGMWPFPEGELLRVAAGCVKGLGAMHAKGLAHRDMKPHNVLLGGDGTPVLMDLGSAEPARRDVETKQQALDVEDQAATKCSAPYRFVPWVGRG